MHYGIFYNRLDTYDHLTTLECNCLDVQSLNIQSNENLTSLISLWKLVS